MRGNENLFEFLWENDVRHAGLAGKLRVLLLMRRSYNKSEASKDCSNDGREIDGVGGNSGECSDKGKTRHIVLIRRVKIKSALKF